MVKFSNGRKGRPSKRTSFKVKYKIERKVKQHRKRVKKQAKKLKGRGLKHKRQSKSQFLPNMFPFKHQLLEEAKRLQPSQPQIQTNTIDATEYGLINIENKPLYFPKPKELFIKKYLGNVQKALSTAQIVLQVLDARDPLICINQDFRKECSKRSITVVSIITKIDTVKADKLAVFERELSTKGTKIIKFSYDHRYKNDSLNQILKTLEEIMHNQRKCILVAGKSNTGKHTLINCLAKHVAKHQDSPSNVFLLKLSDNLRLIDSPIRLQDQTHFPLFDAPNPLIETSLQAQEELTLRQLFFGGDQTYKTSILNRTECLIYYEIQQYVSVDDLVKKIGKSNRIFGKGGMVDVAKVRHKILSDWFVGRLNNLINKREH